MSGELCPDEEFLVGIHPRLVYTQPKRRLHESFGIHTKHAE
jgi:hypothetical protein